ncbi:MAG: cation-translocating P-type ATPase [Brumimicrobium sp.]|nr:cation-translocating P-type ATPase [Brumimicrobium sp.]
MINIPSNLVGLTDEEVIASRTLHAEATLKDNNKSPLLAWFFDLIKEPMLLLLIAISIIYLIVAQYGEAIFMFAAIVIISGISFYQDFQTKRALKELEKLNEPLSAVIRNQNVQKIPTHDLVIGDLCIVEEGKMINADGKIVHSNDFSVNEAALTGESYSIFKNSDTDNNQVYSGTIVMSGLAVFEITAIGKNTRFGKIGESLRDIELEKTPLNIQISQFVKYMAFVGIGIFLLVWIYSYFQTNSIVESLLYGLTMAMSILPEEIPVAFTTFMALGAWKLMQKNIIVKRSGIVETLGSTTVICVDKTGTITENSMILEKLYNHSTGKLYGEDEYGLPELEELIEYAMWSSEPVPFDPMEKTLQNWYLKVCTSDKSSDFNMIHEYPLEGKPPMMTHIYEDKSGNRIIAAKGAPEAILTVSHLDEDTFQKCQRLLQELGNKGYRILGIAKATYLSAEFPKRQQEFDFQFLGFTIFYDPPKKGIQQVFQQIYDAGIKVKVITGDNPDTSLAVANQAGIKSNTNPVKGSDLEQLSEEQLCEIASKTTLFSRMYPQAKLSVVKALKKNNEIVAMIGDGVNDAPALKAAHIGVAMGSKGTEIAKAASDLIITNDNLDRLIYGIGEGRRIYTNIKKAIQYVISIHIPIILTVSLPLLLGWIYPQIFTPIHVIFLEIVMGPTCSIVYENEPMEENTMTQPPRKMTDTFLNWKELNLSILQGLIITIGVLGIYQYSIWQGYQEELTRTMVFTTLILANIFLSFINRSFYYSVITTLKYKNKLLFGITLIVIIALFALLYIPIISKFFHIIPLTTYQLGIAFSFAASSVLWFEVYKWIKRRNL